MSYLQDSTRGKITVAKLRAMRETGEKIAALTCYDATFATLMNSAGVDVLLVGDSLGNVLHGHDTTLSVTLEDVAYHTRCVARGNKSALIVADVPFGWLGSTQQAYDAASTLMRAGAHMLTIEGGEWTQEIVAFLVARSIPVCGRIGLTRSRCMHSEASGFRDARKWPLGS